MKEVDIINHGWLPWLMRLFINQVALDYGGPTDNPLTMAIRDYLADDIKISIKENLAVSETELELSAAIFADGWGAAVKFFARETSQNHNIPAGNITKL